jgi:nucleotide-binding universal stress UspA family protein
MPATQMKQMVTFRNILFATDFSAAANLAMPYAAGLARSFGAKLYALHVQEPANYALPPEIWQTVLLTREKEEQILREAVKHDFPEVTAEVLEGEGNVWAAIEAAIKMYRIDLIVVGTRGRTGVEKILLGSEAEEVLRRAPCPVLTVGPGAKSRAGKPAKITSILYATSFGAASLAGAPLAVSLAEEYQARLTLLHVIENRKANDLAGAEEFGESSERVLRALVPDEAKFWCAPHFMVEQGVPEEKILEVAQRVGAELIVLGSHKPEGVRGAATHLSMATVHKVVAHAECPVLSVPVVAAKHCSSYDADLTHDCAKQKSDCRKLAVGDFDRALMLKVCERRWREKSGRIQPHECEAIVSSTVGSAETRLLLEAKPC